MEYFGKYLKDFLCYYLQLLELFLQVIQQTEFGQLLDLTSQDEDAEEIDLTKFTLERYQKIVKYKTAFYTFYLPVAIGMITSRVTSDDAYDLAKLCLGLSSGPSSCSEAT